MKHPSACILYFTTTRRNIFTTSETSRKIFFVLRFFLCTTLQTSIQQTWCLFSSLVLLSHFNPFTLYRSLSLSRWQTLGPPTPFAPSSSPTLHPASPRSIPLHIILFDACLRQWCASFLGKFSWSHNRRRSAFPRFFRYSFLIFQYFKHRRNTKTAEHGVVWGSVSDATSLSCSRLSRSRLYGLVFDDAR